MKKIDAQFKKNENKCKLDANNACKIANINYRRKILIMTKEKRKLQIKPTNKYIIENKLKYELLFFLILHTEKKFYLLNDTTYTKKKKKKKK